jgi:hypothetical protein
MAERIAKSVNDQSPPMSLGAMDARIKEIVAGGDLNRPSSRETIWGIKRTLDDVSPFKAVKRAGWRAIPGGDAQKLYRELDLELRKIGIWIVPEGELEGFLRTGASKGQQWLEAALSRELAVDSDLESAREFVRSVLAI